MALAIAFEFQLVSMSIMDETVNVWWDNRLNAKYEMSAMGRKFLTLRYTMARINNAGQSG